MTQPDMFGGPGDGPVQDNFSARDAMLGWMQEIAPYGIFTTDVELRIRSWNHWLAVHSGLSAEKVVGQPLVTVFPDVQRRRLDEHFRRALAGEISLLSTALHRYLLPMPAPTPDADIPHMLQTARIAPLPAGDLVIGTITIVEDVTQRETQALLLQRQQERDHLLSAAQGVLLRSSDPLRDVAALFPKLTLPLGLESYFNYLFDAKTETLRLNTAGGVLPRQKETVATLHLGEGLCGLCAQQRTTIMRSRLHECEEPEAQTLRRMGFRTYCCFPLLIEDRLLGTLSFASTARETLPADEVEFLSTVAQYLAIAIDRAQREETLRLAQRRLSEHAEILESKVLERTARLHETIAQLESFSYTVAHDLRAPIRSLKGYCDILLSDFKMPDGSTAILERLRRASNRLDALTRDLLSFTKISRREVELEPVDVNEVVHDLLQFTPALQDSVVNVQPPLEQVWAQRTLLQQCLSNLLDNAVKFAAPGRPPRIVIRCERGSGSSSAASAARGWMAFNPVMGRGKGPVESGGHEPRVSDSVEARQPRVRIWIEDNGIGIAPEAHQKIFGIFERVSGLDHIEGTGIGLAIVARAMQRMGGHCGVESIVGQGSRFWLEFAPADGPAPRIM